MCACEIVVMEMTKAKFEADKERERGNSSNPNLLYLDRFKQHR